MSCLQSVGVGVVSLVSRVGTGPPKRLSLAGRSTRGEGTKTESKGWWEGKEPLCNVCRSSQWVSELGVSGRTDVTEGVRKWANIHPVWGWCAEYRPLRPVVPPLLVPSPRSEGSKVRTETTDERPSASYWEGHGGQE